MSAPDDSRPAELWALERAACLALLGSHDVGRVIVPGADPMVTVVNYAIDHDGERATIVFRTDPGPLVDAVHERRIVFEVDVADPGSRSGWSVAVQGVARRSSAEEAAARPRPWAPGEKACWVLVAVDEVKGRMLRGEVPASWRRPEGYL
jgi:hypothetical protein